MTKLDHALALAAQGFKVFPIAPGKKAPPLLNGWPQKATDDPEEIRQFWLVVPDANVGIHCEGLLVIDVDYAKGGDDSLAFLRMTEDTPDTLVAATPTGGSHHFYRLPEGHAGVLNSVEALGKGLDIRSTGGYVVAAGSEVTAGLYAWQDVATPIAPAPQWLVDRLGAPPVKAAAPLERVADAPESAFEAAQTWLDAQGGAVEGDGGDIHTFAVACGLRDRGVSESQALDLMVDWDSKCAPPWGPEAIATKIHNAYRYAQNAPGARVALPGDFPLVDAPAPPKARTVLTLAQFATQESHGAGYVVKGLLQRRSYASIYGAPGAGKTFVGLDIAYSVAAGHPWMDRKVHAGPVLYLAFEGTGGLVKRAQALRQKYGTKDVPLYIAGAAFNLRAPAGRAELGEIISALPAKPVLIFIDTFARALSGGDENSAQDVGAFNSAIAALIESTAACVVLIHHSGKDKSKGARGSSALLGALDTEIEVDGGAVIARKQRDIELGVPIGFRLTPMRVGMDADGDIETSCVVEPAAIARTVPLKGNARYGFKALEELSPQNAPVDVEDWKAACAPFLSKTRSSQAFHELKDKLLTVGLIVADGCTVTRRME